MKTSAVAGEYRRGAVALVHVAIDDRNRAVRQPSRCSDATGDGDVVEDAVAFAAIGERVMRAAGEVGGAALPQSRPGGRDGRADRSPRAFDHLRRPGKADPPLRLARQCAVAMALK